MPESWGGKHVRCRACNNVFMIPAVETEDVAGDALPPNLEAMAQIEYARTRPEDDGFELQDFEGSPSTIIVKGAVTGTEKDEEAGEADPLLRVCPECRKPVRAHDTFTEMMCAECGAAVPSQRRSLGRAKNRDIALEEQVGARMSGAGGFYDGFVSAFVYPFGAVVSIVAGMGVAFGAIFLPIGTLLAFAIAAALNPLTAGAEVSWVKQTLSICFLVEAIYFGGVCYYVLIDTIRTTALGTDRPPTLTWNLTSVGSALAGYCGLAAYYLGIGALLVLMANNWHWKPPIEQVDFLAYRKPFYIAVVAAVSFSVPMNVIGLASGRLVEGFNPYRIIRSIAETGIHYMFLFLVVIITLILYVAVMSSVVGWSSDRVLTAIRTYEDGQHSFMDVVIGLVAWSILIAVGFYFAYVMGRLLGLFARSFRKQLAFNI